MLEYFFSAFKPRLRVTCYAEDPFLIGRELISQGCDWPNENLLSVPVKQPKLFQVLLSFPSSIASRAVSRYNTGNRVCEKVLRATHHTGLLIFTLQNREEKQGKSENYIFKRFDSPRFLPF
jgi:hypothetical protein